MILHYSVERMNDYVIFLQITYFCLFPEKRVAMPSTHNWFFFFWCLVKFLKFLTIINDSTILRIIIIVIRIELIFTIIIKYSFTFIYLFGIQNISVQIIIHNLCNIFGWFINCSITIYSLPDVSKTDSIKQLHMLLSRPLPHDVRLQYVLLYSRNI